MKTLFIQTHELAKKLDPSYYTCGQVNSMLGEDSWSFTASHVMMVLYLEQKEDRRWNLPKREDPYFTFDRIFMTGYEGFTDDRGFRQRLINSLLTRPDRTLCVLIPE